MARFGIDKGERNFLIALFIFALVDTLVAVPLITSSSFFVNLSPLFAYPLYNIGFIAISVLTFGTLLAVLMHKKYDIKTGLIEGISVWIGFSWIFDLWQPPFYIDNLAHVIIDGGATASNTAVDAFWYSVFNLIPQLKEIIIPTPFMNFSLVYLLIYGAVPVGAVFILAIVLSEGKFMKYIGNVFKGKT